MDDLARSPDDTIDVLFLQQLVQDGHQPLFELDVVVVRHQEVSNSEQIVDIVRAPFCGCVQ